MATVEFYRAASLKGGHFLLGVGSQNLRHEIRAVNAGILRVGGLNAARKKRVPRFCLGNPFGVLLPALRGTGLANLLRSPSPNPPFPEDRRRASASH